MTQLTFADAEYQAKKRTTRRERFLEQLDQLVPWAKLERQVAKAYPKAGRGRQPYPLRTMLRVHVMQICYNLSDPGMEDALYEIESMRRFAGLSLTGAIPDETTILNFRRRLEQHELGQALFETIGRHLEQNGLMLRNGTIVDASIIAAPSSTKNKEKARDPEMHQTKKGNEWHFGMKVHIGVDDCFGTIHHLAVTPANTHDLDAVPELLHGKEDAIWGDAGYRGIEARAEHQKREANFHIAERPSKRREMPEGSAAAIYEKRKARMRAKVEHPFLWLKRHFGYSKVRYRGLAKNLNRLLILAGITNLMICRRYLPT